MASKYSKFKVFHFQEKLDSLPKDVEEISSPIHIRIKPTNVCNHSCWYCSYRFDEVQLGQDMVVRDFIPKDRMMEILDDCIEMDVKSITFSGGGEPFVYKYFLDTVKKLSKSNIKFASLTNGSKLKGEVAEIFSKYGEWIRVSMDGWDDLSYKKYRKTKKTEFTNILNNMKEFKSLGGKCALGVSFIIDNKNFNHIYEMAKKIKATGADSIKMSPCIVSNLGKENNEYHAPIYDEVKKQIKKVKTELEDESFEVYDTYHLLEEKFEKDYDWCPYIQILPIIGADLNIYSCQDKAYNLDNGLVGNIKEKSFKEFWFNDKEKFFKINPKCDCSHHCIANEKNKMILDYLNVDLDHLGFV
ncbi:radical SAM/SPASM domain-containing protein [Halarcobacter ebronensis]|uniref:Radical SAM protein n=1 Tax=Halarcobacter ebronensis TaxID=1462615 RepID=A0A4Q1ARN9_9BACT|nr:radical SAM protein [Halarcobacter ebronensis]QKF83315.1 radical SAM superfamily enzyme, MoaA/NifB/PqqE/SkfB family [Halarcobacter ebronensis]RXK05877.1 radical SAM protein [Halarcobacter ebronensis]